ncbi:MAG: hypothetical protein HXN25_05930 [Prevotella aurantiaca]|nr:hypothetical protein [Prevotella aurantiaca]
MTFVLQTYEYCGRTKCITNLQIIVLNRPHSPLTARTWHLSVRVSILPMGYFRSIRNATQVE